MVNNNMQYISNHNSNNNIDMAQVNVLVANCICLHLSYTAVQFEGL